MALRRCLRCERLYSFSDEEERPCRYHSGTYKGQGVVKMWSCCRDPLASAIGCRVGTHIEDADATAMLDSYYLTQPDPHAPICLMCPSDEEPVDMSTLEIVFENPDGGLHSAMRMSFDPPIVTLPLSHEPAPPAPAPPPAEAPAEAPPPSDGSAAAGGTGLQTVTVPYIVGRHDTFASIAMRHKMTPAELMRCSSPAPAPPHRAMRLTPSLSRAHRSLNGLRRQHVLPGKVVLVWAERSETQVEEEKHRAMLRQFRRLCRCTVGEALHYLETAEYDMGAALLARNDDVAWERQQDEKAAAALAQRETREKEQQAQLLARRGEGEGATWWGRCAGGLGRKIEVCCGAA